VCFNERQPVELAGELIELLARFVVEAHERGSCTVSGVERGGEGAAGDCGVHPPHA
jgi:hypothetical protein